MKYVFALYLNLAKFPFPKDPSKTFIGHLSCVPCPGNENTLNKYITQSF